MPSVGEIILDLEVMLEVFGGRSGCLLEGLWEVDPGASRRSLWVSLGSLLEVDLGFVKVSMLSGC